MLLMLVRSTREITLQAIIRLAILHWIWLASWSVAAELPRRRVVENLDGIKVELRLDEPNPKFLEPVYGFIELANDSGKPKRMLGLDGFIRLPLTVKHCTTFDVDFLGRGVITCGIGMPKDSFEGKIRPADYRDHTPFVITCVDSKFVGLILEGSPSNVSLHLPILLEEEPLPNRPEVEKPVDAKRISEQTMLVVERKVMLKVDSRKTVFRDAGTREVRLFLTPSSWIDKTGGYGDDSAETLHRRQWMRSSVPLLFVFPNAGGPLLKKLKPNTATRRFLTLWELPSDESIDVKNPELLDRLLDAFVRLLIECGPAEAVMLRKQMDSYLMSASREASPRNDTQAWSSLSSACRDAFYQRLEAEIPELNQFRGVIRPAGVRVEKYSFSVDALAKRLGDLRSSQVSRPGYEELFAPLLEKAQAESTETKVVP